MGQKRIGRIAPFDAVDSCVQQSIEDRVRSHVVKNGGYITLLEMYDLIIPTAITESSQVVRDRGLTIQHDLVFSNEKVPVTLRVDEIYFLAELGDFDRKNHENMIEKTRKMLAELHQKLTGRIQLVEELPSPLRSR